MNLRFLHILAILLALLATGCRDPHTADLLARADAVMESAPDSARMLLDSVEPSRLGAADLALYAVLDAQSRHKLDLPAPSDSLLTIAVDRCIAHGPDSLLMKALFYRAVGYQTENTRQAIQDVTNAWDIAHAIGNLYWKAKSADFIADLYHHTMNMNEEIVWREQAASDYMKAARLDNHLFSLCDLIPALTDAGKTQEAMHLADSLCVVVGRHPEIPTLDTYFYSCTIPLYAFNERPDTAQDLLDSLSSKVPELPDAYALYQARIHRSKGYVARAMSLIDQSMPNLSSGLDSILFLNEKARCLAANDDYRGAFNACDTVIDLQYDVFHKAMAQPMSSFQRDVYKDNLTREKNRSKRSQRNVVGLCVLLVVLTAMGYGMVMIVRKQSVRRAMGHIDTIKTLHDEMELERVKNMRLQEANMEIMQRHDRAMAGMPEKMKELNEQIELQMLSQGILYRQKWDLINTLCSEFSTCLKEEDSIILMRNLKHRLVELKDTSHFKEIEDGVNKYMDNLMARIRTQCKFLREDEFLFLTLLYAGLSAKAIAFFTDRSSSYTYTRRDRMKSKFEKSDAPDKEEFIRRLKLN